MKFTTVGSSGAVFAVALFTRAWIEIQNYKDHVPLATVALFTRAWIEMANGHTRSKSLIGRPLHEGVD